MKKALTLSAAAAILLSGCASIVSDSQYPVSIQSSPSQAKFEVKDSTNRVVHTGVTPMTVTLDAGDGFFKKANYTVDFTAKNGKKSTQTVSPTLDPWYFGNILFGGLIGLVIVDPATGAMYKLPEVVNAAFVDDMASNSVDDNTVAFASIDMLTAEQQATLIRVN